MNERFFSQLQARQLILLVVQAFYYTGEPTGHIPRANDIEIMIRRGNECQLVGSWGHIWKCN